MANSKEVFIFPFATKMISDKSKMKHAFNKNYLMIQQAFSEPQTWDTKGNPVTAQLSQAQGIPRTSE